MVGSLRPYFGPVPTPCFDVPKGDARWYIDGLLYSEYVAGGYMHLKCNCPEFDLPTGTIEANAKITADTSRHWADEPAIEADAKMEASRVVHQHNEPELATDITIVSDATPPGLALIEADASWVSDATPPGLAVIEADAFIEDVT